MPYALSFEPEPARLHQLGLEAAVAGQFDQADEHYEEALAALSPLEPYSDNSTDLFVQYATIVGDQGFTYVRRAMAEHEPWHMDTAASRLHRALELTAPLMSGAGITHHDRFLRSPRDARRELWARHGATLGMLARQVTAEAVLFNIDTAEPDDNPTASDYLLRQQLYGTAYDTVRRSGDEYLTASTALCAARQVVLNRQPATAIAAWVGRANVAAGRAVLTDWQHVNAIAKTTANRLRDVTGGYEAARESVFARP